MPTPSDDLVRLAMLFVPISLASIGGGAAAIPAIQHDVVALQQWATPAEFLQLFAISRASPGPGTMLATAIGWHVGGWAGALVATLAFFLPSSLFCLAVIRLSGRYRDKNWHRAIRKGLAPLGIGLVLAGVFSIIRISDGGLSLLALTFSSTAAVLAFPKFPTVGMLLLGGLAGMVLAVSNI